MIQSERSTWLVGGAAVLVVLLIVGLWYRYLGPGSVPPPPTRVEAPDIGGMSPKARALMYGGR